ncbi:MAG: transcription-repair coupling factor, partial [Rhodospirillaceae bacterium]|nr:transcription-repair coupling factor [Rhodospirillaceae bacterium]
MTPEPGRVEQFMQQVAWLRGRGEGMALLPDRETLPYDLFSPHPEITSRRLETLSGLLANEAFRTVRALFVAAPTLLDRLPPRAQLRHWLGVSCRTGQELDPDDLRRGLDEAAYLRVPLVNEPGEYAVRGALLDIFPSGSPAPVRIEFFDREIESIRRFNPTSQRSTGKLDSFSLPPARELPLDSDSIDEFRERFRRRFPENPARAEVFRKLGEGVAPQGAENYLPLFFERTETLWDHLPSDSAVVLLPGVATALESEWEAIVDRYRQRDGDLEQPCLPPEELFAPPDLHKAAVAGLRSIDCRPESLADIAVRARAQDVRARPAPMVPLNRSDEHTSLEAYTQAPGRRILLAAETAGQRELVRE